MRHLAPQIPTDGTPAEIAAERVAKAVADRATTLAAEDAAVAAADSAAAAAQARAVAAQAAATAAEAATGAARAHRTTALAEQDELVDGCRAEAARAAAAEASFRARVAADGLDGLDVKEAFALLQLLGAPVPLATLEREKVSGGALAEMTEAEMESAFGIAALGDRRRLSGALRRLANRQGFGAPGTLEWDTERVCAWLAEQGLAQLRQAFRAQSIDGEVLLTLTRDDLQCLGVTTIGDKSTLMKKVEAVKKQHYAGQVVGARGDAGSGGASKAGGRSTRSGRKRKREPPGASQLSAEQQRLVLEQVLEENADLAARLAAAREDNGAQGSGATAAPPADFLCPITTEVMQDPVFAMDGFTYEREAIAAWFRRHDTSPITRAVIPPTLVPNNNLRSQIASWNE